MKGRYRCLKLEDKIMLRYDDFFIFSNLFFFQLTFLKIKTNIFMQNLNTPISGSLISNFDVFCFSCFQNPDFSAKIFNDIINTEIPYLKVSEFLVSYSYDQVFHFFNETVSNLTIDDLAVINFNLVGGSAGQFVTGVISTLVKSFLSDRFCKNYQNYFLNQIKN